MTEPFPAKNVVDLLGRRSAEQRPAVASVPDTIAKVRDATFPLLLAALRPGGHLKLPQSWPGQNPPAECAGRMDGYTVS